MSLKAVLALFVGTLVILTAIVLLFRFAWTSQSRLRETMAKACLSFGTLALLWVCAEITLYLFHVKAYGRYNLATKRWFEEYWSPVNSIGYRDAEIDRSRLAGKHVMLVVGDSFVAGYGIKDYRRRFAGIIQQKLPGDWMVVTVARMGWNTSQEYAGMVSLEVKPDIVVLSYYINDIDGIDGAAARHDQWFSKSQVEVERGAGFHTGVCDSVQMPEWLAIDKGII